MSSWGHLNEQLITNGNFLDSKCQHITTVYAVSVQKIVSIIVFSKSQSDISEILISLKGVSGIDIP